MLQMDRLISPPPKTFLDGVIKRELSKSPWVLGTAALLETSQGYLGIFDHCLVLIH